MEELTLATVEWEIEMAVLEHERLQLRKEKHKLQSHLNYLNIDTEEKEVSELESFYRNQEALEVVEARMTALGEELARLESSKGKQGLLEPAVSGDGFELEEKELQCLDVTRQLRIAVAQINHMKTAIDLLAAQLAFRISNGESYSTRMKEGKCACDTQSRQEIVFAELMCTQGSPKTDVQRQMSSLKITESRLSEVLEGVQATSDAAGGLELEKCRLFLAASQAELRCTEKERELGATEEDLAGLRCKLNEAELHERSLPGHMGQLTGAKLRWEVERAGATLVIDKMRQENDGLRFNLTRVNAEVEERQKAIFDSFRRSQQVFEQVEARLIRMEQELGGLETSQQNLEKELTVLGSTISSIALEEMGHKYLEMQRRVNNAEVQMYEMQADADSVIAQVLVERDNWEVKKRRMKDKRDARETELRDEIAAAELKLVAIEGSLKVALHNLEDLSIRVLQEGILKLSDDAKISTLKITEQQQEISRLRRMSMALEAECTEADDNIVALNQLREPYLLAEASSRLELELLTRKLEDLEVSAGQMKSRNLSKERSSVSNIRGERSQCLPECVPVSEDQKHFAEAHLYSRQTQEIEELRGKISDKERTIRSTHKEMQKEIVNLKEAELEMNKVHRENHRLTQIQLENRSLIEILSLKCKTTEDELFRRDIQIKGCEAELQKVVGVMLDWETKMRDVETEWRKEKAALTQELTEAKLAANEKRTETGALLQNFQNGQATLKEAEDLVDALVKANENSKLDALDWKTQKENLRIVQGWWMPERDKLVSKIARLETYMHTQQEDIWIMCKEEMHGLAATMDLLLTVDKELVELKNDHQQDLDHLAAEMRALKDDLVSLLDLEGEMRSSFEDMQTVVFEFTPGKARTLKDLPDFKLEKEQRIALLLKKMNIELKAVENERNKYQTDLVILNEQFQMAQTKADELEIYASETREAAERSKSHAEEKEEEARILERSVEELESTVYALDCQLDIVKRDAERQRVTREALENELVALKREMGLMQVTMNSQEAQTVRAVQRAETSKTELDRIIIEMKNQQTQARRSVESLQQECAEKDVQLRNCKARIAELGAEKQASGSQRKLKDLEATVEHPKMEERKVNSASGSVSKAVEKSTGKVKGAASSFKCIGSGLDKQRASDMDEELSAAKNRIKDLETVATSRQKEVFILNTKLAEAESMTHDVVRDLLGVKMDIAGYATMLNQRQGQRVIEQSRRRAVEAQQKEDELNRLRHRRNDFIEEREGWLGEMNRRQTQAVAARASAEDLRLSHETLSAENEKFREDNHALRKKVADLDGEIKKLSGQQKLEQRLHQHAKTKEANNSIRLQNMDLSGKLRRMEVSFTSVNDELAQYRAAEGKSPFQNFDEEARLKKNLPGCWHSKSIQGSCSICSDDGSPPAPGPAGVFREITFPTGN